MMMNNTSSSNLMIDFMKMLISSIPEPEFEARLKEFGIEDKNITKLKEIAGYNTEQTGGDE